MSIVKNTNDTFRAALPPAHTVTFLFPFSSSLQPLSVFTSFPFTFSFHINNDCIFSPLLSLAGLFWFHICWLSSLFNTTLPPTPHSSPPLTGLNFFLTTLFIPVDQVSLSTPVQPPFVCLFCFLSHLSFLPLAIE